MSGGWMDAQVNALNQSQVPIILAPMDTATIVEQLNLFPLPVPANIDPRPLTREESGRIDILSQLQFFLATAPTRWASGDILTNTNLSKFQLPNGEHVSCVLWNGLYHITGTDIVRALAFRFEAFGRPVKATKKWEEGVFSDLRNLKPGTDASLEEPKSPLLDFLFRNGCIRTQKKQKVFYWFSVPHDRLFLDALERDLKREKAGQDPTTGVAGEPARSFRYDPRRSLYEQFAGQNPGISTTTHTSPTQFPLSPAAVPFHGYDSDIPYDGAYGNPSELNPSDRMSQTQDYSAHHSTAQSISPRPSTNLLYNRTVFEGSPAYKRRRGRSRQEQSPSVFDSEIVIHGDDRRHGSRLSNLRSATASPGPLNPSQADTYAAGFSPPVKRYRGHSSTAPPDESLGPDDEDRFYTCAFEFCRRPFKRLEHLKRHMRTHTNEKPYDCIKCTRSFSRQDNLVQHLRTHDRLEPAHTESPYPYYAQGSQSLELGGETVGVDAAGIGPSPAQFTAYSIREVPENLVANPSLLQSPDITNLRHSTVPPNWPSASYHNSHHQSSLTTYDIRRHRSVTPNVGPTPGSHAAYSTPTSLTPEDPSANAQSRQTTWLRLP